MEDNGVEPGDNGAVVGGAAVRARHPAQAVVVCCHPPSEPTARGPPRQPKRVPAVASPADAVAAAPRPGKQTAVGLLAHGAKVAGRHLFNLVALPKQRALPAKLAPLVYRLAADGIVCARVVGGTNNPLAAQFHSQVGMLILPTL